MRNIFLPGAPITTTHQMKQVNWKTRSFYEPPKVKQARAKLTAQLSPYRPAEPTQGAVNLTVEWFFPTKDKRKDGMPKTTRPDCDNMVKLLLDVMTALRFWNDDAQVTSLTLIKRWSEGEGGTLIQVKEHEEETQ